MSNRPVRDCIKREAALVGRAQDSVQDAARRMAEAVCSSILVCDGDRLQGIFTERDLLVRVVAAGLDPGTTPLGQVMTANPDTIDGGAPIIEAIRRMDELNFRHMPIMDRGRILGVVSWRDLPFEDRVVMQDELDKRHTLAERMW
jgi:CBS domain-containing protein